MFNSNEFKQDSINSVRFDALKELRDEILYWYYLI